MRGPVPPPLGDRAATMKPYGDVPVEVLSRHTARINAGKTIKLYSSSAQGPYMAAF